jgi:hypothetical protein
MAERQLPKLHTRVRFPSPAPNQCVGPDPPMNGGLRFANPPMGYWRFPSRFCNTTEFREINCILFQGFPRKKSGTEFPERGYFIGQLLRN